MKKYFVKEKTQSKSNKKEKLVALITKWSLLTTFHCFPKIFQDKNIFLKLIWTILFLVFSVLTSWLAIKSVMDFFQYELISKIQIINEKPAVFPGITLCNVNPFSSKDSQILIEKKFQEVYNLSIDNYQSFNSSMSYEELHIKLIVVSELTKMHANSPEFTDEQRKNLTAIPSQIPFCIFNKKLCNKSMNWVYIYDYGNCFQFNVNQINEKFKETELEGSKYGLSFFMGPIINENKYPTSLSTGLRIFVHNQSFSPSSSEGLDIEMGKETTITIKRTFTSNVPYPFSECVDTSNLDFIKNYKKYSNKTYRQQDCFDICLQQLIIETCQCYFTGISIISHYDPCLSLSQYNCIQNQSIRFVEMNKKECKIDCPLECETVTYDLGISSLIYPNKQSFELFSEGKTSSYLNETITYDTLREKFLILNIYYPTTKYTFISQIPKTTLIDLISNVGGAIGIFLGFSIFSLIELLEIFLRIFYIFLFD